MEARNRIRRRNILDAARSCISRATYSTEQWSQYMDYVVADWTEPLGLTERFASRKTKISEKVKIILMHKDYRSNVGREVELTGRDNKGNDIKIRAMKYSRIPDAWKKPLASRRVVELIVDGLPYRRVGDLEAHFAPFSAMEEAIFYMLEGEDLNAFSWIMDAIQTTYDSALKESDVGTADVKNEELSQTAGGGNSKTPIVLPLAPMIQGDPTYLPSEFDHTHPFIVTDSSSSNYDKYFSDKVSDFTGAQKLAAVAVRKVDPPETFKLPPTLADDSEYESESVTSRLQRRRRALAGTPPDDPDDDPQGPGSGGGPQHGGGTEGSGHAGPGSGGGGTEGSEHTGPGDSGGRNKLEGGRKRGSPRKGGSGSQRGGGGSGNRRQPGGKGLGDKGKDPDPKGKKKI